MAESINKIESGIKINVGASVKTQKTLSLQRDYIWNPATSSCENGNYLVIITDDSAITSADIMKPYNKETNFNGKKATCKTQNFYILLTFSLITLDY